MFRGRTKQALQPPPQVRSLAYVGLRLRIVATEQKNCRRCRDGSKYLGIADRNEL